MREIAGKGQKAPDSKADEIAQTLAFGREVMAVFLYLIAFVGFVDGMARRS